MEESILTSIKKLLGIADEYEHFDLDIIMHINSVLSILTQIGAGPSEGFSITDKTAVWSDFISDPKDLHMVKSYVYLKVRLMFDPPTSSATIESMNRMISEYEWRINLAVDPKKVNEEDQNGESTPSTLSAESGRVRRSPVLLYGPRFDQG